MTSIEIAQGIADLAGYSLNKELISESDTVWARNLISAKLGFMPEGDFPKPQKKALSDILTLLCDYAFEKGLIPENTVTYRDLFDTDLMGILTPRPSDVFEKFKRLYKENPAEATDYFYRLACDSNYIRTDRISRDVRWSVPSAYGDIDLSINLSKPEKDPKAIAKAKLLPQSGYPKCLLCHENEGFAGNEGKPARQNLRQIPFDMAGTPWYLQYSPYVYYNEHCIALSSRHEPMKIDRSSFAKLLGFVETFPHYFIGSNADLPIVGGSILAHDHMQGGRYTFAMERAGIEEKIAFEGYSDISAGIVKWPLSVIRLSGENKERLVELADRILLAWRKYSDPDAMIFAETDGEPHNTVTPIARMRDGKFELDVVLRNNLTTPEHPLGLFHPHEELHHIKKENIGLIEVMGLAVLPARLKAELSLLADFIRDGKNPSEEPSLEKHAAWVDELKKKGVFENVSDIYSVLLREVGFVFVRVLEDAGVYKCTPNGRKAFKRFLETV